MLTTLWIGTITKGPCRERFKIFSVFVFDESLIKLLQQSKMDIHLGYWNDVDGLVKIRYYDFQFITRPNTENLASLLGGSLTGIPLNCTKC